MPQLDLLSFTSVAFFLTLCFLFSVYVLSVYVYPKIGMILKFRDRISMIRSTIFYTDDKRPASITNVFMVKKLVRIIKKN